MLEDGAPDAAASPLAEGTDFHARLDALRARGATQGDAVRLRFIESMARRAAGHGGVARQLLDERLAGLLAAHGDALEVARSAPDDPLHPADAAPRRGAFAELIDLLERRAAAPELTPHAPPAAPGRTTPTEPQAVEFFRRTWARLSAEQRLAQSRQALPENAGPLHSHHLVHRSLTLMRDLSPEYFDRFVSHIDALLWLEQAGGDGAKETSPAPRIGGTRKLARGGAGREAASVPAPPRE